MDHEDLPKPPLNFVITGQARCGAAVIQTSVDSHPQAKCHADLLHEDSRVRREYHEDYFGRIERADLEPYLENPESYLTTQIFDNPKYGERVIGVKLLYPQLDRHELWDFIKGRQQEGDFCAIHIKRNPLACYVSLKQAQQTGVWQQESADTTAVMSNPQPVRIDVEELVQYCRWHEAHAVRTDSACEDRLVVQYRELFLNYREVMAGIFEYLELPTFTSVTPGVRRLKNRNMQDRILNFNVVRRTVPGDIQDYFDAEDLF